MQELISSFFVKEDEEVLLNVIKIKMSSDEIAFKS